MSLMKEAVNLPGGESNPQWDKLLRIGIDNWVDREFLTKAVKGNTLEIKTKKNKCIPKWNLGICWFRLDFRD